MVTIYALKDPETRKIRYVGQTVAPKKRLRQHLLDKCRCHRTNWIAELKSRGLVPEFEALFGVPDSEAAEWEIRTIASAKNLGLDLVNQTIGGAAPMTGKKHTAETLVLLSINARGRKKTEATRAKLSAALKGVPKSPQHCLSMSRARTGVPNCSEEKKVRQSEEMTGKGNPHYGKFGKEHPAFGTKRAYATSFHKGVSWDKSRSKWRAVLVSNRKQTYIGRFDSEQEAIEAVIKKQSQI